MKFYHLLLILSLGASCKKCREKNDDDLCSLLRSNNSETLRLSGYYFYQWTNQDVREVLFLYRNGVMIKTSIRGVENYDNPDYFNLNLIPTYKNTKFIWGIYSIQDSIIQIEKWYPSEVYFPVFKSSGRILNDSTFVINHISRCDGSEASSRNETWHFKKFSPKPDSTNRFTN